MTIDTDLATLRYSLTSHAFNQDECLQALQRVEAELARLRQERDEAKWGRDWQYDKAIGWRERALAAERELARLRRENESLKRWQLAYAKGREGLVKQADQDFERAEAAERELARLQEGLRDAAVVIEKMANGTSRAEVDPEFSRFRALLADTPDECKHGIIEIDHATGVASCPKCGAKL